MVGGIVHESAHRRPRLSDQPNTPGLRTSLVDAYPTYVAAVLTDRGIEMDELTADAIVEGAAVLDGLLTTFEETPYPDQRTSPLELFREALRPVDRALALRGVEPPSDEPPGVAAWDRYQLSPGSSQVLGEQAHEAHLRWAIGKAQAIAPLVNRPGVAVLPKTEASIGEAVHAAGFRMVADVGDAVVALVDVDDPDAQASVALATSVGLHVIAFGDAIDDLERVALTAAGVDRVVTREALLSSPEEVLPSVA